MLLLSRTTDHKLLHDLLSICVHTYAGMRVHTYIYTHVCVYVYTYMESGLE